MGTKSFTRFLKFETEKEIEGLIKALDNNKKPKLTDVIVEKVSKKRILEILGKKQ